MFAWAFPLHALGGSVGFAPQVGLRVRVRVGVRVRTLNPEP
jgi:hypothetical protein